MRPCRVTSLNPSSPPSGSAEARGSTYPLCMKSSRRVTGRFGSQAKSGMERRSQSICPPRLSQTNRPKNVISSKWNRAELVRCSLWKGNKPLAQSYARILQYGYRILETQDGFTVIRTAVDAGKGERATMTVELHRTPHARTGGRPSNRPTVRCERCRESNCTGSMRPASGRKRKGMIFAKRLLFLKFGEALRQQWPDPSLPCMSYGAYNGRRLGKPGV
jgi:hypothetical protein